MDIFTNETDNSGTVMFNQALLDTLSGEIKRIREIIEPGSDQNNRLAAITDNLQTLSDNIKDYKKYFD